MKHLLVRVTVSVVAASVLAACGGGGGTENAAKESSESSTPSPEAEESPAADTEGAGTPYCELLGTDFASKFGTMEGAEDVEKMITAIDDITAEAPDEIAADWETVSGAMDQGKADLVDALELQKQLADGDIGRKEFKEKSAAMMKSMEKLDTKENSEASLAVAEHASKYCGVSLGQ